MAIPHARPGEVIDVRPLAAGIGDAKTQTIIKTNQLEVIRVVMPAGKQLPPHAVPGEITVQCLEGNAEVTAGQATRGLPAGSLLYLAAGSEHSLRAIDDSSLLVTILLSHKK
jgi:quercetin dioxygenase-like cupin family protein